MSLITFVGREDVRVQLDRVLPKYERTLDLALLAPPRGAHPGLVGAAFDYACRFEIQRRNRRAREGAWIAEQALARLPIVALVSGLSRRRAGAMAKEASSRITRARRYLRRYVALTCPTDANRRTLAAHAVCLARLDVIYRIGLLDGALDASSSYEIAEVAELIATIPGDLGRRGRVMLNPTFGKFSELVGGADADLITNGSLIDIKTTKHPKVEKAMVRQLVGYLILARAAESAGGRFPQFDKLGIYFSRHGHLWKMSVQDVIGHKAWAATERWFLATAATETRREPGRALLALAALGPALNQSARR